MSKSIQEKIYDNNSVGFYIATLLAYPNSKLQEKFLINLQAATKPNLIDIASKFVSANK